MSFFDTITELNLFLFSLSKRCPLKAAVKCILKIKFVIDYYQ